MTDPSYDTCLVEAELRARAAYAEPDRHHHDERHLDDCLERLAGTTRLAERDHRLLRWAILWHDAVYEPGRGDNEERSAGLARRELLGCGVARADADQVARLILLTKNHAVDEGDRLGALMVSIDLSVLGSDPNRYRAYAEDVRREHAHLTDDSWRKGRSALLEALLARDPLYPDAELRAALEPQARRNMEKELSRLRED